MRGAIATTLLVFLVACSGSTAPMSDRYQFVGGSNERVDFVFDRATGCIAEINWVPDWARNPEIDLSKPIPKDTGKIIAVDSFMPWRCPNQAPASTEKAQK